MISKVTVTNYLNQSLELDLRRPDKTGLLIANITGLGPGNADILMTDLITQDGSIYNMSRRPPRSITFTIKNTFTRDEDGKVVLTEEDTRLLTYKYFPLKKFITLTFVTKNRHAMITGHVEANEAIIFSNQVHTTITIICPDPNFYSVDMMYTTFEGVINLFEFPYRNEVPVLIPGYSGFSNESLTENLIEMGEMWPRHMRTIYYQGDVEVGVILHLFATGNIVGFAIVEYGTNNRMSINHDRLVALTGSGIVRNDHIIISTIPGRKSITLIRNNREYNILNALNRDAFWFRLHKGDNTFAYTAETGIRNVVFRLENRIGYEGI